tara:strand:- start:8091 stop:8852 length:762 start_codon:yes stop_codon:yes gene_type:complete
MDKRVRQKTFSRISNDLRERTKIETDKGELIFQIDSNASIPKGPENKKGEPETFEWISTYLSPGETVIDIGANIGVFSLYAALIPNVHVVAFEPSANSFSTLNTNIRLNGLDGSIEAYCLGASNETKLTKLYMKDSSSGSSHNSVGCSENQFGQFDAESQQAVFSIKLDDFVLLSESKMPNHIKLDVDGIELQILEGSKELLKTINSILIEIEGKNSAENLDKINTILKDSGLKEERSWRNKGSKRNRLFTRK